MANTDVTTKQAVAIAANNEVGRGYTRQVTISFQDLLDNEPSGSSDNDTQTYELFPLPVGCVLLGVYYYVRTAFDDSGGGTSLTVQIGDTDDADGILLAKQIHDSAVVAAIPDGTFFTVGGDASTYNGKVYTTANTVEALFTPASYKLSEVTAGEIVFVADIVYTHLAQS